MKNKRQRIQKMGFKLNINFAQCKHGKLFWFRKQNHIPLSFMIHTLAMLGSPIVVVSEELLNMRKKYFSSLLSSVSTSRIGILIEE